MRPRFRLMLRDRRGPIYAVDVTPMAEGLSVIRETRNGTEDVFVRYSRIKRLANLPEEGDEDGPDSDAGPTPAEFAGQRREKPRPEAELLDQADDDVPMYR